MRASDLAASPENGGPPALGICECVKDSRCWGLTKTFFAQVVDVKKKEVEGALPGRYFPRTETWALYSADKDGHFLRVTCGPARAPCASYRDQLEWRLVASALLKVLPHRAVDDRLFHPVTWIITAEGEAALSEAKRCRPGLWSDLAPALTASAR